MTLNKLHRWSRSGESSIRAMQADRLRGYLRDVVLPYSPYYRERFQSLRLRAEDIRSLDDLRKLPFTSKADLLPTPEKPLRFREFILSPDPRDLAHRPRTITRALLHGRAQVQRELNDEFRPKLVMFTTGPLGKPFR